MLFFFLVYHFLSFSLFRWKLKKKTLHDKFAFNSNSLQIEHIVKKIQIQRKKIKQSARSPQLNQRRPSYIFEMFYYRKGVRLAKYQIRMCIKIMAKAYVKTTFNKHNLGRLGLKPIPGPLFFLFSFWGWV
jgi:hypothetical protein